jgi:hypothetical protein
MLWALMKKKKKGVHIAGLIWDEQVRDWSFGLLLLL